MSLGRKKCINCNNYTLIKECVSCLRKKISNDKKEPTKKNIIKKNLLIDKYEPKKLNDLIGNKKQIIIANNWIKNYKSNNKNTKRALIITGPPGIGKTTFAKLFLKKNNYDIIEFNASDIRNKKMVNENLKKIMGKISIMSMMGSNIKLAVIMDEVDGMTSGDRGGVSELLSFINPKKNKMKNPIICISNTDNDKKIKSLKNNCEVIKFMKPLKNELYDFIKKICKKESKNINDDILFKLIDFSQQDIRKLLCILEFFLQNPKQDIDTFLFSLDKKNIDSELFTSSQKILTEELFHEEIIKLFENHSISINQVIHENIIDNYENFKDSEKKKNK